MKFIHHINKHPANHASFSAKCLKHIMQNRESWSQIDAYFTTWPHSSIEDVYELLNDIVNLNFNMINIPLEEFDLLRLI